MFKMKLNQQQIGEIMREFPQAKITQTQDGMVVIEGVNEQYLNAKYCINPVQKQENVDFNSLLTTFVSSYARLAIEKEINPIIRKIETTLSQMGDRLDGVGNEIDKKIDPIRDVASASASKVQDAKEEIAASIQETKTQLEKIAKQFDDKVSELANDLEKNITAKIKEHLAVEIQALQDERQLIKHTLEQENKATNERICKIADHYRKFLQDFPKLEE